MTVEVPTSDPDLVGFTYIKRKSRTPKLHKSKSKRNATKQCPGAYSSEDGTIEQLREKYATRCALLRSSEFFKDFQSVFSDLLEHSRFPRPKTLKMLGIGTLTHNPSLTQLAFGLELANKLDISLGLVRTSDPMYTRLDSTFLTELGLVVDSVEEGNQHNSSEWTLVFAPHVPKSVYEALLRAYWHKDQIQRLVLIGNNLIHYPDIYSDRKLKSESPAILAIGELLEVVNLPNNFEYNNVFNDLAVQWFKEGQELPILDFCGHEIEKENLEINQDKVKQKKDSKHSGDQSNDKGIN